MSSVVVRSLTGVLVIVTSLTISVLSAAETVEPVVVTATRTAETADSTLSPMIIIDAETIARNAGADVADILREYAGIEIGRNGGPGQNASIFIRGANSNQTLMMIDGVKINPGTLGTPAVQNIDPNIIDHIEVVKGPRSTLYGSDAIGGVINIITKQSTKMGSDYIASVGIGSYDTHSLKLNASNRTETASSAIQISGSESRGFPTLTASSNDRGYDNFSLNLSGQKKLGESTAKFSYWHTNGNTQYLDDFSLAALDQNFINEATALTIASPIASNWLSTLKFTHARDEISQNQLNPYYPGQPGEYAHTQRYVFDWQNDFSIDKNQLFTAGVMLSNEHTQALSWGTYFDENTPTNALFIQDKIESQLQKIVLGVRLTDNKSFGQNTTWNIEYGYSLTNAIKIILANNSGFRAPDSTDRFGYNGNPDLKPEKSINNEVGIRYSTNNLQRLEVNAYYNRIKDLVDYTGTGNTNIDEAEIRGVETIYSYKSLDWDMRASATVQNPRDIVYDKPLARRATHIYTIYGGHKIQDVNIGINLSYSSNRADGTHILDSYTLANLTAQYSVNKNLIFNARIENLTNEDYQLAYGYRTPGRSGYVEMQYHFE